MIKDYNILTFGSYFTIYALFAHHNAAGMLEDVFVGGTS